ncbi:hypothetical protein Hdeb2414_s0564g00917511 [Helianthus debilis subsp. tardiflorus]
MKKRTRSGLEDYRKFVFVWEGRRSRVRVSPEVCRKDTSTTATVALLPPPTPPRCRG